MLCYSVALADIDPFSSLVVLRFSVKNCLWYLLLAPFPFSGNSGTSVIFSFPEGWPDSVSVFL
jgi:hypothetical protein